jgi:hypothetical protein
MNLEDIREKVSQFEGSFDKQNRALARSIKRLETEIQDNLGTLDQSLLSVPNTTRGIQPKTMTEKFC